MSKIKICLDAGHYGKYNPSPVVKGYYESDMNWKLHNLLKKYLEQYGIEVIQTRSNQAGDLALVARGKTAKGCVLFLSIHSNASETESTDAPLAIVALSGKADSLGQKLADCVASTMGTKQKGKIWKRKSSSGSEWYGVLRGAAAVGVPGIILEHSYHTNTKATKWLMDDSNLDKLAQAEAKALAEYYGQSKIAPEKPATVKLDKAASYAKKKAGTYKVKSSDGLKLRAGGSTDKAIIENMKDGSNVTCYGYYTGDWLYVVSASGKEGYCHSGYLVKK